MVTSTVRSCGFQLTTGHFFSSSARDRICQVFFSRSAASRGIHCAAVCTVLRRSGLFRGTAVDVDIPAVEFVAFDATTLFSLDRTQIHGVDSRLRARMVSSRRVERFGDVVIRAGISRPRILSTFVVTALSGTSTRRRLFTQLAPEEDRFARV